MKKTFLFGLASAALLAVGCTNDETVEIPATKAITFANAFVDNNTKADPSFTKKTLGAFDVYGYVTKGGEESKIFDGTVVSSSDKGSTWTYDAKETQYWIPGGSYIFAAIAPSETSAKTALSDDKTTITTTVEDFENTDGTTDLIYSTVGPREGKASGNDYVKFTFKHLLSKLKFTFVNGFEESSNISLKVTEVKIINAAKTATVVTTDGTTDNTKWTLSNEDSISVVFGNVETNSVVKTLAPTDKAEALNERLIIPTTVDQKKDYIVTFKVEVLQGDKQLSLKTYDVVAHIRNQEFKPGYAYNITATLDKSISINESSAQLETIKFSVEGFTDWTEGTASASLKPQKPAPSDES